MIVALIEFAAAWVGVVIVLFVGVYGLALWGMWRAAREGRLRAMRRIDAQRERLERLLRAPSARR